MKKTQRKDAVRNILKEKVSYLSILIIALLAVASFLGINFASMGIKAGANEFYQELNFRDIELISTMLLEEDDVNDLLNEAGVRDAEGVYLITAKAIVGDIKENVSVISETERINLPKVLEGELPKSKGECAIEEELTESLGLSVGDTIHLADGKGNTPNYLFGQDYKITGVILHPDHIAHKAQVAENKYVYVTKDAFDRDALSNCYMKAVIEIDKSNEYSYYDKDYLSSVQNVEEDLSKYIEVHEDSRAQAVQNVFDDEIEEAEGKLAEGKVQLDEARSELDENQKKLEDGEKELEEGKVKLDEAKKLLDENGPKIEEGQKELDGAKSQLDEAYSQLSDAYDELDAAVKKLDTANAELVNAYNQVENIKADFRSSIRDGIASVAGNEFANNISWASPSYISDAGDSSVSIRNFAITSNLTVKLEDNLDNIVTEVIQGLLVGTEYEEQAATIAETIKASSQYADAKISYSETVGQLSTWEEGQSQYIKGLKEYNAGLATYNESLAKYNSGLSEYNSALAEFQAGKEEYEAGLARYEKGVKDYEDGIKQIEEGKEKIAEGEEEYATALAEYEKAKSSFDKAKEEGLGSCNIIPLNVSGNGGYVHVRNSADNVGKLGKTFAALFIVLGALVIYATVGRIIDEQRRLVGAQKALGFFSREVFLKHLAFGVSGTVLGVLLGTLAGHLIIQKIVLMAHEQFYVMGSISRAFSPLLFGLSVVFGILLSAIAVLWACISLLRETARELMQDAVPKSIGAKEGKQEGSKHDRSTAKGSLYSRLIYRNILTDLPRVLITIVSIAGCCVLLVIGFTLRYSVNTAVNNQFDDILKYDAELNFDPEVGDQVEANIRSTLDTAGITAYPYLNSYLSCETEDGITAIEVVAADSDELKQAYLFRSPGDKKEFEMPETGAVLQKRIAEAYGLNVGDDFILYDASMNPHTAKVTGVMDYYFGGSIYMSREAYLEVFGEEPVNNRFFLFTDKTKKELTTIFSEIEGFDSIRPLTEVRKNYTDAISIINLVTLVLIIAAGLMAFFILLNLVNMYLNKKKKELTIMRVNGFTTKEVIRYVSRESIVTTVLGMLLGFVVGSVFAYMIIRFLEQPHAGFVRAVSASSLIFSGLFTAFFSFIINAIALRKVKNLKLSDVA